jgi:hypothetical protein
MSARVCRRVDHVRRNEKDRSPELHCGQVHESEEVPEERIGNQPLTLLIEADRKEVSPVTTNQHMTGFDLDRQAETKLLLQVGLDVPAFVIGHRYHDLEQSAATKCQDFGDLGLREAAELDIAEGAHGRNNGAGAAGLHIGRVERTLVSTSTHPRATVAAARAQHRALWRWLIPVGGGLLAAVLIVIGTPHVAWYLRIFLALIAFIYIAGQSAAYLWSSNPDHG